ASGLEQFVRFGVGGDGGRAGCGIFHRERLEFVGRDGAREGEVIPGTVCGEIVQFEIERARCGEDVILEVIAGLEIGVVTGEGDGDGRTRGKIWRESKLQRSVYVERTAQGDCL